MAFYWTIDSRQRQIVATPEGEFTAKEFRDYLATISGAQILDYRQLLDLSGAFPQISDEEATQLGAYIRHQHFTHSQSRLGPLAVVLPGQKTEPTARLLGFLATAPRLMRLFHERKLAIRWLVGLP